MERISRDLLALSHLDALRGFVAVARRSSVTRAAEDLCLTQSAVSRQVRTLERALGCALLERRHRGIALTAAGSALYASADAALRQIAVAMQALGEDPGDRRVTITASAGVAGVWLLPLLGRLGSEVPEADVRLAALDRVVADLRGEEIDLAIRYCAAERAPAHAVRLFGEAVAPVAHPALGLRAFPGAAALAGHCLLEFEDARAPWLRWGPWLRRRGLEADAAARVIGFNRYDQLVQAALAGQGIALGRLPLLGAVLDAGGLVRLTPEEVPVGCAHGYWLFDAGGEVPAVVARVRDWLRAQAPPATAD
ncbi:LysR substrate-binding domain-containing protein [Luteimonas huabeiensis]|uniref:LysR substrate-binding domain-containing protein n=1 Tax=Luteimonas huabeiensis TaxID=1244513 RepID=UPI0004B55552|nr:LysR substrate-binding domain-containing protein [Luteimonas huabeiensis]